MSYIKQNWKNGDVITAEKLNHIEDGISESGGGAQADYNQNNSTASDYIKNRPFYSEISDEWVSLVNGEYEFQNLEIIASADIPFSEPTLLSSIQPFKVTFDNVSYDNLEIKWLFIEDAGYYPYIGATMTIDPDTGDGIYDWNEYPFCLDLWAGPFDETQEQFDCMGLQWAIENTSAGTHTVNFQYKESIEIVHKIDSKYLPDNNSGNLYINSTENPSMEVWIYVYTNPECTTPLTSLSNNNKYEKLYRSINGEVSFVSTITASAVNNEPSYVLPGRIVEAQNAQGTRIYVMQYSTYIEIGESSSQWRPI